MNCGTDIAKVEMGRSTRREIVCVDWQVDNPVRIEIRQGRAVRGAPLEFEFYQPLISPFECDFEDLINLVKSYQPT